MSGTESVIDLCSVGKETKKPCHKKKLTKIERLININELDEVDKKLVGLQSGVSDSDLLTVCEHHKLFYLTVYESTQNSCFDPYDKHKKKVTSAVRTVSLDVCEKINKLSDIKNKCKPGQKMCDNCRKSIDQKIDNLPDEEKEQEETQELNVSLDSMDIEFEKEKALEDINEVFANLDESPFKLHGVASHSKEPYAKKKMDSARSSLEKKIGAIIQKDISTRGVEQVPKEVQKLADDMQELIRLIKIKLAGPLTRREKIQLLTLTPTSWSREKAAKEFGVSEYVIRKARYLLKEEGLLALPAPRKGKTISDETARLVKEFYQNDEYSRLMPGQKDKVSIAKNEYAQKRLLLCNLNELYASFKFEYPNIKLGFSKFTSLRPKWCVLPGSSGSHSVCVCSTHENVRLLLHAAALDDYHEFIKVSVCSIDKRDCMLGRCSQCPGKEHTEKRILEKFEEWDPEDEIEYSSWVSTDRTKQIQQTVTMDEYLETLVNSLEDFKPHSFITKAQSKFLKEQKQNLKENEALVLMDFSQNFTFVTQDEVQGAYWTRNSCSLHPVVIYTKPDTSAETCTVSCLCMISDDLEHDVAFVYETKKVAVQFVRENYPGVKTVHYWTDGCAMQYKNCKNFKNLCCHEKDFNLSATWNFFGTSHGKSACDGIGGTVKRTVARASLQRIHGDVINTAEKMFKFCTENIGHIKFWFLPKEAISATRQELEPRFSEAKTVPGTRSFHHFQPLSETSIGTKRTSADENFTLKFNFTEEPKTLVKMSQIIVNSYVACEYYGQWFVGLVLSKDEEQNDVEVSFLSPHGPSPSFGWPRRKDVCFVPVTNIISCISPPSTKATGRMFYFAESEMTSVAKQFLEHFSQ